MDEADEVDNVWSDRRLPFEIQSTEPVAAQAIPESPFGIGHI